MVFYQLPTAEQDPVLHAWLVSAGLDHMCGEPVAVNIELLGPDGGSVEKEGMLLVGLQPCKLVLCFGQVEGGDSPTVRVYCLLRQFAAEGSLMAVGSKAVDVDNRARLWEEGYKASHQSIPAASFQFAAVWA